MNVPMSWLRQYVDIDVDLKTYVDTMTMSGSKVEAVVESGKEITKVVAGKIIEVDQHPDADRLRVMQVDIGKAAPLQIVTAATNVQLGDVVPVALDGATLAKGVKIKSGKLRGVESQGMFCSVEELGFEEADIEDAPHDGVYVFKKDMPALGSDVKPYFGLGEAIIEYEITSNRADCFSILGIAREAAATFNKPFKYPEIKVSEVEGKASDLASVTIHNDDLCPRYAARIIQNVKVGPSPKWLKERLISAGLRPINNIVDITNYMLLEFGQPMHAFDYDKLAGHEIHVRNAKEGEKFVTLFGEEVTLDPSMLVIADKEKAVALGGVMGGENSKVTDDTTTILFECANFNGYNIRQTSKKLNLQSDSSIKYTKGLDPNTITDALERAAQLIQLTQAGDVVSGVIDVYPKKREPLTISYDVHWINQFLGTQISEDEMIDYFTRLEFKVSQKDKTVTIPTFRSDVTMMADLAEEVARLYGYDKIKPTLERAKPTRGKKSFEQKVCDKLYQVFSMYGVYGALTYAFESPKVFDKLGLKADHPLRQTMTIINPLGQDYSVMRTTTLNGMLTSLATNYKRRNVEAALYEIGKVYIKPTDVQAMSEDPKYLGENELPLEQKKITIGMYGPRCDYFTLKGLIETMMEALKIEDFEFKRCNDLAFMHPGRTATLMIQHKEAGYLGEIHPQVAKNYNLGTNVYVAELDLKTILKAAEKPISFKPLPKYPVVTRDIAILVSKETLVGDLEKVIKQRGGKWLESMKLFDVYEGEQVGKDMKSVAYNLTFRAADRTLTDEDVQKSMKKILNGLETNFCAKLRD